MASDSGLERRWRFLVGMGVHPDEARRRIEAATDATRSVPTQLIGSPGWADEELAALLTRLERLDERQRAAVVSFHLDVNHPIDVDARDAAIAILTVGGRDLTEVFDPLASIPAPHFSTAAERRRRTRLAVAVMSAAVVVVLGAAAALRPSNVGLPPATDPRSPAVAAPTTTTTTTSISPITTTAPPPTWVDPDRELEIFLTDDDTVVRLEPWTRRLLWESRPFRDPRIISIDPNTVTIESAGNRLVVSLTDGTLLPP